MSLQFDFQSRKARFSPDPGRLDRRVTLQYPIATRDSAGGEVITWFIAATVWASKLATTTTRLYAAEAKSYLAELSYRIRHRTDIASGWRLVHGDDAYEVVELVEQGRRHLLDLGVRGVNQSPAAAIRGLMLHGGVPFKLHGRTGFFALHY